MSELLLEMFIVAIGAGAVSVTLSFVLDRLGYFDVARELSRKRIAVTATRRDAVPVAATESVAESIRKVSDTAIALQFRDALTTRMADLAAAATPSLQFHDALATRMADLAAATPSLQFYEAFTTRMTDLAAAATPSLQFYEAFTTRMADLTAAATPSLQFYD